MSETSSKLKIILLFAIITKGLTAVAQIHLNAHDKSIRYDLAKPEHCLRKVTFFDTAGNITRELAIDHYTKIDTARKEIDFINSVQYAPGKILVDSSIDNYSGSARYILATMPSTKYEYIEYLPTSVKAHNVVKGVSSNKTTAMSEGYFDDNSLWDILGYIPLKKGIKYQLDCYGTDTRTQVLIPFEIEYVFDENYHEPSGAIICTTVLKVSNPESTVYVWINKKTHLSIKTVGAGKGYSFTEVAL